jgi:hypothetical protein
MRFRRPSAAESAVLATCIVIVGWLAADAWRDHNAKERGARDANADLAKGVVAYHLRGLRQSWDRDAAKIAADSYGINIVRTGGCIASGPDWSYDMAYNQNVEEHLMARFGFDPIQKVFDEARQKWKEK